MTGKRITQTHHHHQVPDLEQTLATMPLQTSLSSDNFKKFKPLLCPPVAELQRLSRNVIRCLPLSHSDYSMEKDAMQQRLSRPSLQGDNPMQTAKVG